MSLDSNFNNMLNEYLAVDLLKNELKKQDYFLSKVDMDESAKGGSVIVPFEGQYASSIAFGSLTDDTDIADYKYVRGSLAPTVEATGTLKFHDKDLRQHNGKINESSFLRVLPGQVSDFVNMLKCAISVNALNGSHFATLTVNGTAGGLAEVDRPERFTKDQKCVIDDNNSAPLTVYVTNVDVNGGTLLKGVVTLSATRGGGPVDISAYTTGESARIFHPGAQASSYTSIKSQLLSLANSGPATLFGQTKTDHVHLQATQIDGSAVSATNILQKVFDGAARRQQLARGSGSMEVLMALKHMGSILTLLENGGGVSPNAPQKGAFNVVPGSRKVSAFGWSEVSIGSPTGDTLKLVGVLDMDTDWMWYSDWESVKGYSNGGLMRLTSPEGIQYFTKRSTSGLVYILDHVLQADFAVLAPYKHAIMHGIPNY
jgi:hypothetical protein